MKKCITILLLFQFCTSTLNAQFWNEEALWIYRKTVFFQPGQHFQKLERVRDTTILNLNCQIIEKQWYTEFENTTEFRPPSEFIVHVDNSIVKIYHEATDSFYQLYDFNLGTADTLVTHCIDVSGGISGELYAFIDSTRFFPIDNQVRKVQHLSQFYELNDECDVPSQAIEGIGFSNYFFPSNSLADPPEGGPLLCYKDHEITYPPGESCEITVSISELDDEDLVVYPNPFCGYLNMDILQADEISIMTLEGHLLHRVYNSNRIDIRDLGIGTYVLKLKADEKITVRKIIKACR